MTLPALQMTRTPAGLSPASSYDAEALDAYTIGAEVEVTIKQRRSGKHHRFFFKGLHELVKSGAVPFSTTEELLSALKMACGITEIRQGIGGAPYIVPGSISYAAKDQAHFRAFTERATALIATHYGVDLASLVGVSPDALAKNSGRAA